MVGCAGNTRKVNRTEVSEDQLAGRDGSVGCWRVQCVDCGRETNVGFVMEYGSEAPK